MNTLGKHGEPFTFVGGIARDRNGTELVYPRQREVDCVNACDGLEDPAAAINAAREALAEAGDLSAYGIGAVGQETPWQAANSERCIVEIKRINAMVKKAIGLLGE